LVKTLVQEVMAQRKFPEQAYKSCMGIIKLESTYTAQLLNIACKRALDYKAGSYCIVANMLEKGLD